MNKGQAVGGRGGGGRFEVANTLSMRVPSNKSPSVSSKVNARLRWGGSGESIIRGISETC